MRRKVSLAIGETYHIYNRGAHKERIFKDDEDYMRFLILLHLANSSEPILLRDVLTKYRAQGSAKSPSELFILEKPDKSLVDILAYSLLPNHYHLVIRQKADTGITKFMNRIGVAYVMYFNLKHAHSGVLFQGPFKSKHVDSEAYFRYIFAYVHLNPLDLFAPGWEETGLPPSEQIKSEVRNYRYSSYFDYQMAQRPECAILTLESPDFLRKQDDIDELYTFYRAQGSVSEAVDKSEELIF